MTASQEKQTELPDKAPSIPVGSVIGDRFKLGKRLSQTALVDTFRATDTQSPDSPNVAVTVFQNNAVEVFQSFESTIEKISACHHKHLADIHKWGIQQLEGGARPFVVTDLFGGKTLRTVIKKKQEDKGQFAAKTALSLVSPVLSALGVLHPNVPHAALVPGNIRLDGVGRIHLTQAGLGWLQLKLAKATASPVALNPSFVAPEVRKDPNSATPGSDIYSLGMILLSLLTGHYPLKPLSPATCGELLRPVSPQLQEIVLACVDTNPDNRPDDVTSLLEGLRGGIIDTGEVASVPPPQETEPETPSDQPLKTPDIAETSKSPEELLAPTMPERKTREKNLTFSEEYDLPPVDSGGDGVVWLIHKDRVDFGPFTAEQIKEQLQNDAIDEYTELRNLDTQEHGLLCEVDEFADFVVSYLPERQKRREVEAERRAAVQRKVKRASAAGVISILVGVLGILGFYIYYVAYIKPQPEPIVFESLFARVSTDFSAPDQTYVGIAANADLIAALFNFDVEVEEPEHSERRHTQRSDESSNTTGTYDDYEDDDPMDRGTIDFTTTAGTRRLTSNDINDTISGEARGIQRCFRAERDLDPSFGSSGDLEIQFTVRPDGRPIGVDLAPGSYSETLRSCLVRVFRSMRFPEHDGLALPVTFPFHIRSR